MLKRFGWMVALCSAGCAGFFAPRFPHGDFQFWGGAGQCFRVGAVWVYGERSDGGRLAGAGSLLNDACPPEASTRDAILQAAGELQFTAKDLGNVQVLVVADETALSTDGKTVPFLTDGYTIACHRLNVLRCIREEFPNLCGSPPYRKMGCGP